MAHINPSPVQSGTSALTRIAQTVLGSTAATIDFTSIPQTYETLLLVVEGRGTATPASSVTVMLNGDSGANYQWQYVSGAGASATAGQATAQTSGFVGSASGGAGDSSTIEIKIPSYARTVVRKSFLAEAGFVGSGGLTTQDFSNQWNSTAAITRVTLSLGSGNWDVGTVATLYGMN